MAIKPNKSLDFEYEYDSPSGVSYSFPLRYYQSEEYGPTLAILNENDEPAAYFPVSMFSEVADFLTEQGIIEGKRSLPIPHNPSKTLRSTSTQLPKPRLVSKNPVVKTSNNVPDVISVDLEDESVDETFIPQHLIEKEKARQDEIKAAIADAVPQQSLLSPTEQAETLSDEELSAIMLQRQNAVKKVKTEDKSIRRK